MKKNIFFYLVFLTVATGCSKDEDNNKADFSILGLEQLVINDEILHLNETGLPIDIKDKDNMSIIGCTYGKCYNEFELVVLSTQKDDINLSVKSRFEDTVIDIKKEDTTDLKYSVTITRPNYEEKVKYKVSFMNFPKE